MNRGHSDALRDPERLQALERAELLDTPPEEAFDQMTRLAARLLRTPVSLVSLVDRDRQFFKSCIGLPTPWAEARETPLSHSFCQYVVAAEQPLIVEDAREDPVLRDNLAIRDMGVVAYLGVPLFSPEGKPIGSLCTIDSQPRRWSEEDLETLRSLAGSVMSTIQLRSSARAAAREADATRAAAAARGVLSTATTPRPATLEEICEAADQLWSATGGFLRALDEYDRLIRTYEASAESLDAESRLRDRIAALHEQMRQGLEDFSKCADRMQGVEDEAAVHAARGLASAIREYFHAEDRRAEASKQFQELHGPLEELERAVASAARAERRVRDAADAFEVTR